jgi:hydrogenase maturation protease
MSGQTILIAGIGNIFFGDDAFGVEVIRRLQKRELRPEVKLVDFGIRGYDLAQELANGYDWVILVDAARSGAPPGTLHLSEPILEELSGEADAELLQGHGMVPTRAIAAAAALGAQFKTLRLVSCEPASLESNCETIFCLSDAVSAAADEAVVMIESLIEEFIASPCTNSA